MDGVYEQHSAIDRRLAALLSDLDELDEYVLEEFDDLPEAEQDIWLYEWPNKMAKLRSLQESYRAGEMSAEQAGRYRELRRRFNEIVPSVHEVLEVSVPEEFVSYQG